MFTGANLVPVDKPCAGCVTDFLAKTKNQFEKVEFYVSKTSVESGVNLSEKIFNISWNVQDG